MRLKYKNRDLNFKKNKQGHRINIDTEKNKRSKMIINDENQ